jgi:membrane-bound ClpP family serine protease
MLPAALGTGRWGLVLLALLAAPLLARAEEPAVEGLLVQIPTEMVAAPNRLRSVLHGPLKRFEAGSGRRGGTFRLLCDFNPDGRRSESDDFFACAGLANYLRDLPRQFKGVQTIAYVHGDVRRHSVLPVLACTEIVLSTNPQGRLGKITRPGQSLTRVQRTAYDEITLNRYPPVLIRKMFDADVEVIKAGDRFADARERPRPRGDVVPELVAGDTALYTFELASRLGLCKQEAHNSIEELLAAYDLPRSGPRRALDRTVCWRIPIEGAITGELKEKVKRRIERALRARANLLILELRCSGGESEKAYELGLYLCGLNERRPDNPVETIAYVTSDASNTAAFLAFACNKIVMQREVREGNEVVQKGARLGDFDRYLQHHPSLQPLRKELANLDRRPGANPGRRDELERQINNSIHSIEEAVRKNLADVAERQRYPVVLAAGLVSRDLRIHAVEPALGKTGGRTFLGDEDFRADQADPQKRKWRSLGLVKPATREEEGKYLTLTAERAVELGVAGAQVKDFEGLCELEGVDPAQVRVPEADWLDGLADFLRDPWTSVVLVMLGITCLILELKMPGVGLPGVVAAICFVLFFWAHSQLNGQITWLAILLFVLGLLLIGMEIFILPGFGVPGISGILLVLAGLGLVAYGHWPRSGSEWVGFGQKIGPFGISMLGSLVAVVLIARYLPHIPVLNRLMHRPAEESAEGSEAGHDNPMHAELAALLGAIGVAATPLRPAGKAQFGDAFVDVVADGGYIPPGTRVQVIEVEGNRVVVKEV